MPVDPDPAGFDCPACGARNAPEAVVCMSCGRVLSEVPRVQPGMVLNERFEIREILGAGGMGVVLKGYDRELEELVAIKVLREDLARSDEVLRRFRSENKLARRVRHRNVCAIHEFGTDRKISYIAMELIEGTDIKHLIRKRGALPPLDAFNVCIQIAEGLQAIHDAGIVHRDLKTSNAMLDAKGRVVLMDFGIAKDVQSNATLGATAIGQIIGTPEYMSPEQARGEKIDARSDLYALGIIIFEIFSGQVPFQGTTPLATLFKNLEQPPPLDGPEAAGIPEPVIRMLARALAKSPAERFQSAAEMAEALRLARDGSVQAASQLPERSQAIQFETQVIARTPVPGATPVSSPTVTPSPTAVPNLAPTTTRAPATLMGDVGNTVVQPVPPAPRIAPPPPPPVTPRPRVEPRTPPVAPPRPPSREGLSIGIVTGAGAAIVAVLLVAGWLLVKLVLPAPTPTPGPAPSGAPATTATLPTPEPSQAPATTITLAPTTTVPATVAPATTVPVTVPATVAPRPSPSLRPPATTVPSASPLEARSAVLQFVIRPWAEIAVDGRVIGTSPVPPLTLPPGTHTIQLNNPDYKPLRRTVTVEPGQTLRFELDLRRDGIAK